MSRSGYVDDCENLNLYRASVERAIGGARGQAFLRELLAALDAMPNKRLISEQLESETGEVCALGCVGRARKSDMSKVWYDDPTAVGKFFGIARSMAAEIEFINDDDFGYERKFDRKPETPEQRYERVRKWVVANLKERP